MSFFQCRHQWSTVVSLSLLFHIIDRRHLELLQQTNILLLVFRAMCATIVLWPLASIESFHLAPRKSKWFRPAKKLPNEHYHDDRIIPTVYSDYLRPIKRLFRRFHMRLADQTSERKLLSRPLHSAPELSPLLSLKGPAITGARHCNPLRQAICHLEKKWRKLCQLDALLEK